MAEILELLRRPFELGSLRVSVLSVLVGLGLFVVLMLAVRIARQTLRDRILPRAGLTPAVAIATSTLAGYALLVLGTLVILPVMLPGFNLDTLSLMLGAVSLGVGFGLRNIADNFMSGLILLVERPIKVGFHIWEEFKRQGIEIPYPQRDLYVKEFPSVTVPPQSGAKT